MKEAKGQLLVVTHRFYEESKSKKEKEVTENGGWNGESENLLILLPQVEKEWKIINSYCRKSVHLEVIRKNDSCFLYVSGMEELEAAAYLESMKVFL